MNIASDDEPVMSIDEFLEGYRRFNPLSQDTTAQDTINQGTILVGLYGQPPSGGKNHTTCYGCLFAGGFPNEAENVICHANERLSGRVLRRNRGCEHYRTANREDTQLNTQETPISQEPHSPLDHYNPILAWLSASSGTTIGQIHPTSFTDTASTADL
jgi:hypothetical protein